MDGLSYYLHGFWEDHGDSKVSADFPLMYGGPWKLVAITALYAFLSLSYGPKWMQNRKPFELRPYMLVYNGFMFGVNGAGFLVALWVTQMGTNSWHCQLDSDRWSGIQGISMKYMGYTYLWIKLMDFVSTGFAILRKKEGQDITAQVIHNSYMILFPFLGLKFYAKGIFAFLPMMDLFLQSVRFAFLVLASAGKAFTFSLWWKKYVTQIQILQQLVLLVHSLYMTLTPNCEGPAFLKIFVGIYATCSLPYYARFYHRKYLSAPTTTKTD